MPGEATVSPQLLAIGHICRDDSPDGWTLGGSVYFAAQQAIRLGVTCGIVTAGQDAHLLPGWYHNIPSEPTRFRNEEGPNGRVQHIDSVAAPITSDDIPAKWRGAPIVFLGPLAGEISTDTGSMFPHSLVVAAAQGWLRERTVSGRVVPRIPDTPILGVRALVVSLEDLGGQGGVAHNLSDAPVVLLTRGAEGADLTVAGITRRIAPYRHINGSRVGAGDIFAASFAIRLHETGDPFEAGSFATAAAGHWVLAGHPANRTVIAGWRKGAA